MAIIRWDPFRDMTQVRPVQPAVDQVWSGRQESWLPAVDVFDTKEAVVLKAELAGMDPTTSRSRSRTTCSPSRASAVRGAGRRERYHRIERRFGSFQRSLALPQGVKAEEIAAGYEDGILTVTVPKAEEEKPKRIEVKATKTVETKKSES